MTHLQQWDKLHEEHANVSLTELDEAMKKFVAAKDDYAEKKQISNLAHAEAEKAKTELISLMKTAGKKRWEVEGLGKISHVTKQVIRVPKDLQKKKEMLKYMRSIGENAYLQMVTVNHNTLNGFYNLQIESNPEFRLPGVEAPTVDETIRFNRSKV